jgi:Ca2+-binding RTX toxin-like protein
VVIGGPGDDTLRGSAGQDVLSGGSGQDLFRVDFRYSNGFQYDPDSVTMMQADDLIQDFVRGQDKLQITYYDEGPEHPEPGEGPVNLTVTFDDLDTNGDGVLDGGDSGVTLQSMLVDGEDRASLVLDVAQFTFDAPYVADGTITLLGVTALGVADIDVLTPKPSPHGIAV